MNLFDAVPVVVKERYDGYVAGDSISTKDFQLTMNEVLDRSENYRNRKNLSRDTYMQIRQMVSTAIDMIIHDRRNFDRLLTDKLIDDLWS